MTGFILWAQGQTQDNDNDMGRDGDLGLNIAVCITLDLQEEIPVSRMTYVRDEGAKSCFDVTV